MSTLDHSQSDLHTTSCWRAAVPLFDAPLLRDDTTCDVCVVGAGLAGLTTAYLLAKEGRHVVLLDAGGLGTGETERTTAHLSNALDDRFYSLERLHGREGSRLAAASHTAAIRQIALIAREESIACDFRWVDGWLFAPEGESTDLLERELEAAHRAGLTDVRLETGLPIETLRQRPCLHFHEQAQFNPLRYLNGLAEAFLRHNGRLYASTRMAEYEEGETVRIKTDLGHVVTADSLVVATNTPVHTRVAMHTKLYPYRTYAVALRIPDGSVPLGLYWDTLDAYHYVRLAANGTGPVLIVGGEDHKVGQEADTEGCFARLEAWARQHFPMAGALAYRWSGQVQETIDGLAYIGRTPGASSRVFMAAGDSGMGMTHGTIAGLLLTDLIQGRENPWAKIYDPSRTSLRAAKLFTEENLNVARQYLDWVMPEEKKDVAELAPLSGCVVQRGLHKVAVYRDEEGVLHERSAVCPHLGCVVQWNTAEHSWDCPCHGSRFGPTGEVVNGPANTDLAPAASAEEEGEPARREQE